MLHFEIVGGQDEARNVHDASGAGIYSILDAKYSGCCDLKAIVMNSVVMVKDVLLKDKLLNNFLVQWILVEVILKKTYDMFTMQ